MSGLSAGDLDRVYEAVWNAEQVGGEDMKLVASQINTLLDRAEEKGLTPAEQIQFLQDNLLSELRQMARIDEHWANVLYDGDPRMLNQLIQDLFYEVGLEW